MPFLRKETNTKKQRCILCFGSSKQNTHVCIYIQEGDNGVSLNYNRHWTKTRISATFSEIVSFTLLCIVYDSSFLVIVITFPVF